MKRFITAMLSLAMSAVVCMPLASGYAECNSEDSLLPYRNAFDEFNATHGTTYGFMTDEQLSAHNMNRDEYYQEMEKTYTAMTLDEFAEFLENAYIEDMKFMEEQKDITIPQTNSISADTLPYYIEDHSGEQVDVSVPFNDNPMNIVLLEN